MRIIGGSARGRRILSVPKKMESVRPISARIRQSLFDMVRTRVTGSRFLDLFAGTGTVGLEALSRGAELAVFVDNDLKCLKVIERNLERAGWAARGKPQRGSALGSLSWILYRTRVERFDLIFAGPPYVDQSKRDLRLGQAVLDSIVSSNLLAPGGWAVVQHHQKDNPKAPAGFELFRRARYGDSRLSFMRRAGEERGPFSSDPRNEPIEP